MKSLYIWTQDGLRLQGMHYSPNEKDTCILLIHGMSGNFMENYFADVLGNTLQNNNVGFIYAHNRGYNHINDILKKDGKTVRMGAMYERFDECIYDFDAWLSEVRKLGYKKIVLHGHSLGCNKVIFYLSKNKVKDLVGVILASPPRYGWTL